MTAALGPFIMRHPDVKNNMEQFMVQHALPEFSSPERYMRAIVCVLYTSFHSQCAKFNVGLRGLGHHGEGWHAMVWRRGMHVSQAHALAVINRR